MLQFPGIFQEEAENERARRAPLPWFIVSFSGAMYFAVTGTNARVCKCFLCAFQRKPKAPKVSGGSLPWKNMLQVPGICQEAAENERVRRAPLPWFIVSFSGAMYIA